jgi:chromosome partitioning protein
MRLAVCSSKGGVGKSATAANLVAVLGARATSRGGRVLAVDADPQDSLGRSLGVVAAGKADSLGGLLEGSDPPSDPPIDPPIRRDVLPGVDLIPAHPSLEAVGAALAAQGGITTGLRRVLRPLLATYEHVVIDTHGDLGNLTLSAVCAADSVLTVFTSDPGSALGAARVAAFVAQHRQFENTEARLLGVACAMWDRQSRAARDVLEAVAAAGLPLLETRVPASRRVPSATLLRVPVVLSAPASPVAQAYVALADELLSAYVRAA